MCERIVAMIFDEGVCCVRRERSSIVYITCDSVCGVGVEETDENFIICKSLVEMRLVCVW